jgi:hypothetical protein
MKKITVKGINRGNAGMILAHIEKGKGIDTATKILIPRFYVDETGKLTLVIEDDGMVILEEIY